jgi:hypothetical protein
VSRGRTERILLILFVEGYFDADIDNKMLVVASASASLTMYLIRGVMFI